MTVQNNTESSQKLQKALKNLPSSIRKLGFTNLREGQAEIIMNILQGKDTLAILPTSGGKSATYQIPTLCLEGQTLIFSPLIALMKDQMESMLKRGLTADQISSGQSPRENYNALMRWKQKSIQFLLVSPERILNDEFEKTMMEHPPTIITMDECFTPDVELLTDRGFVRFDSLIETDLCAQYDVVTEGISFTAPEKFIKKMYQGKVIRIHSPKRCDITVTPNHELLTYNTTAKKFKKETAHSAKFSHIKQFKTAGYKLDGNEDRLTDEECFNIAFQADGSHHCNSYDDQILAFGFVKQHKIARLMKICNACKFQIWEVKGKQNRRRFMVRGPQQSKVLRDKFNPSKMSLAKCRAFIEEMVHWDGSVIHDDMYYYSSKIKDNADLVQEIAILSGYKTNQIVEVDSRTETYSDIHRVFISKNKDCVGTTNLCKEELDYNGYVYCVRVPKHNIIVRRNGKPIVIGNCHVVSQWSDSFRPQYRKVGDFISKLNPEVVLALTATCTKEIEQDIRSYLHLQQATKLMFLPQRKNLKLHTICIESEDLISELLRADIVGSKEEPTLIYCSTVKRVEAVYEYLSQLSRYKNRILMYHGQMKPEDRNHNQTAFMRDDCTIMVATNAFGLGVDKPNLRRVIHLEMPGTLEAYTQEVGRASRDGKEANCYLLYHKSSLNLQKWFIDSKYPDISYVRDIYNHLVRNVDNEGLVKQTSSNIAYEMRLHPMTVEACINLLLSNSIIERVQDYQKLFKVKFLQTIDDKAPKFLIKSLDFFRKFALADKEGFYSFTKESLSSEVGVLPTTVVNNLNKFASQNYIEVVAPFRGIPIKILHPFSEFDSSFLVKRRDQLFKKLEIMENFALLEDSKKHDYIQKYFLDINS